MPRTLAGATDIGQHRRLPVRTGVAFVFHSAFNVTNGRKTTPDLLGLPEGLASLIPAVAVMVLAALLAAFTRGRLAYDRARGAAPQLADVGQEAAQTRTQ